jgi:hypothetical protein
VQVAAIQMEHPDWPYDMKIIESIEDKDTRFFPMITVNAQLKKMKENHPFASS